jgi:ribosomal-protein-alanine N-acetyltransferase
MQIAATPQYQPREHAPPGTARTLLTPKTELRVVGLTDIPHWRELMSDPAVMKYVGLEEGVLPTVDEIEAIVNGAISAWDTRGYGRWSVFDRETGEFVGFSGFRCEGGVPELISMVHQRYWGNGHAREAAGAVLDYGFSTLGFEVVCSFTRPTNERARALLDKLGAEFLGHIDFHGVEGAAYRIHPSGLVDREKDGELPGG